ncbi:hypothetical protein QYE76_001834 [Lolium multiflorum]|uniref:Uncharacterized protein n=1 Tax=Lolium multiflorum TaxID=4521 RepID=A0AAD8RM33_LOLMU|nr:hypothetical protein QYE76_001834 [Lolium multiflorum]
MYAMLCTRPDIAHAVSLTSRYQSDPGMEHWTAVKNILKYLKRTKDMFLCYGGDQELVVTSYTDASWNTDPDDSKSQSGYVFILNGAAVSWSSSKQCTVAKSSTESEYIAASEASSEAVWMKRFIVELGVVPSALDPLVIYCDNTGAIANAKEPRSHKKLKHIKLRFHSIREYIEDGEVEICKVHTDLNVADPLTKALPSPELRHGTRGLYTLDNLTSTLSLDRRRPTAPSDPLPRRQHALLSPEKKTSHDRAIPPDPTAITHAYRFGEYDQEKMVIFDIKLMVGFGCDTIPILKVPPQYPIWMEYQWECYQLGHGGELKFEKDLKQLVEYLGHPYPEFFGTSFNNQLGGSPRWEVSADLGRKLGAPVWETIWFSVTGNTWKEGLVKAMQEAIARLCGQNENKIRNTRFIYYPRHDSMGRSMTMPPHTEMNPYVAHQDFRQYKTRRDLDNALALRQAPQP